MHERGKSDSSVVPGKPPNNGPGAPESAEGVEERGLAKGNPHQFARSRTQSRGILQSALRRIRQIAKGRKGERFTTLWHHVYNPDRLHEVYFELKRDSAPGVDGVTWQQYGENLWGNLTDLAVRLKRGAYHPPPVERAYIPKLDGRQRPIGKPTLEDKLVQRTFTEVIGEVYEAEFLGFSYGCRPGRSQHNALDALTVAMERRSVNWVLDADIRGFFEAIDHEWMLKFVQHRIADGRVLRQVRKWLKAGVVEAGKKSIPEAGTPQGGSVSPLLANIYLHYVLDLWVARWRRRHARGDVIIVRYVDDFVVGFEHRAEALRFLDELKERLRRFGLELHAEKTRLIEFGRYAIRDRRRRGDGKPETFDFLGFTHICSKDRKGWFIVRRHTMRRRMVAKLKTIKIALKRRRHEKVDEVRRWVSAVLRGHFQYYGVPRNTRALGAFYKQVLWYWWRALRRRSQKHNLPWRRFCRNAKRHLPQPRVTHPYPNQRLRVST
jgi:group II intron reverse transcriptase/maturase